MKRVAALILGMTCAGIAAGALWAWLAPPSRSVATVTKSGKRIHEYLGNEADHFFDSAVMIVGLLVGIAIVAAVLVWQWRQQRGPAMVLALTVGAIAMAAAATGTGAGLVRLRYGHTDFQAVPDDHQVHYLTEAPSVYFGHSPLQVLTTLVLPAAAAALTYAMMAAASAHDDLGVKPSVPETVG